MKYDPISHFEDDTKAVVSLTMLADKIVPEDSATKIATTKKTDTKSDKSTSKGRCNRFLQTVVMCLGHLCLILVGPLGSFKRPDPRYFQTFSINAKAAPSSVCDSSVASKLSSMI